MKYEPALPEHNDNVSHEHPLKEFVILLLGTVAVLLVIFWSLSFFVDMAVEHISPEDEAKIYAELGSDSWDMGMETKEASPALQAMVDSLGQCADVGYPVKIRMVETDDINALALPGGNILLFEGLLNGVSSENGLAFVLAHELGHFKNRDHLRGMGRSMVLVALSVMLTGANSDLSRLLAPTSSLGHAQHSQKAESAADRTALQVLNCHYGHVGGATEFFEKLATLDGSGKSSRLAHYFESHPQVEKRIRDVKRIAKDMGYEFGRVLPYRF